MVSFGSTGGGSQSISLINPSIKVTKNDTLVFDVSDVSLENSKLEFSMTTDLLMNLFLQDLPINLMFRELELLVLALELI